MSKNMSFNAAVYLRLSKEDGDVTDGGKTVRRHQGFHSPP